MTLTEEWTQGYAIQLLGNRSVSQLVDFIIAQNRADLPHAVKTANIAREFSLCTRDAEKAMERVAGGILFAAFGSTDGVPDSEHDPIAYQSYRLTVERRQAVTN
ncbi:MAG: hypothetical protein JO218_03225 [Burkholderiales bacterium]|nr:hypothetical protein [Burkholderiales bacterium]